MPARVHLVEQTASFLQTSSAPPKEKLVIGGKLFRAAMIFSKDWTPELMNQAVAGYTFLLKNGNMNKTVEQMDEKDASRYLAQFTKDVTHLAAQIDQGRSRQPQLRKS
jgi:hypothetical protein